MAKYSMGKAALTATRYKIYVSAYTCLWKSHLDGGSVGLGASEHGVDDGQVVEGDLGPADDAARLAVEFSAELFELPGGAPELVLDEDLLLGLFVASRVAASADDEAVARGRREVVVDAAVVAQDLEEALLLFVAEGAAVIERADDAGGHLAERPDNVDVTALRSHLHGPGVQRLDVAEHRREKRQLVHTAVAQEAANVLRVLAPGGAQVLVVEVEGARRVVIEAHNSTDLRNGGLQLGNRLQVHPVLVHCH